VQLPPLSCYIIALRSRNSSQNPVPEHLQRQRPRFVPIKTTERIMVLYTLTFTFLDSRREVKRLNRMIPSSLFR
jgi:hypothetical protein